MSGKRHQRHWLRHRCVGRRWGPPPVWQDVGPHVQHAHRTGRRGGCGGGRLLHDADHHPARCPGYGHGGVHMERHGELLGQRRARRRVKRRDFRQAVSHVWRSRPLLPSVLVGSRAGVCDGATGCRKTSCSDNGLLVTYVCHYTHHPWYTPASPGVFARVFCACIVTNRNVQCRLEVDRPDQRRPT